MLIVIPVVLKELTTGKKNKPSLVLYAVYNSFDLCFKDKFIKLLFFRCEILSQRLAGEEVLEIPVMQVRYWADP